jgi:hypothetical protein
MSRNFSTLSPITGAELIPTYSQYGSTPLWTTITALMAYFRTTFTSPEFVTTITTPGDGFSLSLPLNSNKQWALLIPTGTLATGTIVLPSATYLIDGQEILITSTLAVTSLTINGNGATAVYGAPTSFSAGDSVKLRYNLLTTSWYKIA